MKTKKITKIFLVLLCIAICAGSFCSCSSQINDEDKEAVESALKRTISQRSDDEIAKTGLTADDVLSAFDNLLTAWEKKIGGQESVRFLAITGDLYYDIDENEHEVARTSEYFCPIYDFSGNFIVSSVRDNIPASTDPIWYIPICFKQVKQHLIEKRVVLSSINLPVDCMERVLAALGAVNYDFMTMSDNYIRNELSSDMNVRFAREAEHVWKCPDIDESVIRKASPESLEVLYSFVKEVYSILIGEDYSLFFNQNENDVNYAQHYYSLNQKSIDLSHLFFYGTGGSSQEEQENKTTYRSLNIDNNGRPKELYILKENTPVKYLYTYDDNGNLATITQMLYSEKGELISTDKISLEEAAKISVYNYSIKLNAFDSDIESVDLYTSIIPQKISFKCPGGEELFYGFSSKLYEIAATPRGEAYDEGYIYYSKD